MDAPSFPSRSGRAACPQLDCGDGLASVTTSSAGEALRRGDLETVVLEQSPGARSSKAPSDPPSEFSSWHDDASSSLATCSAGDRTITVNTQRARMGEHLKGKLQGMIRQRFENYLLITQTLQNDTGKLAALSCELRSPAGGVTGGTRTSISCSEDGTFLVYCVPTVDSAPPGPSGGSSCSSSDDGRRAGANSASPGSAGSSPGSSPGSPGAPAVSPEVSEPATPADIDSDVGPGGCELSRRWVHQVCEFGMSGHCHSLTALFHFGYTFWKQLQAEAGGSSCAAAAPPAVEPVPTEPASTLGAEPSSESVPAGDAGAAAQPVNHGHAGGHAGGHAAGHAGGAAGEPSGPLKPLSPAHSAGASSASAGTAPAQATPGGAEEQPRAGAGHGMPAAAAASRTSATLLEAARIATDCHQLQHALDLCNEGIGIAASLAELPSHTVGGSASSSSSAPRASFSASASASTSQVRSADWSLLNETREDATSSLWQLLLLRASLHAQLLMHEAALQDAERLTSLQPTCAEAYYWQSMALQGLGRGQEALEALMAALEYDPQNSIFQHTFTLLFEELSTASAGRGRSHSSRAGAGSGPAATVIHRRARGGQARDALSTTTQATHLSSRSTTPTEVSAPLSRSSSNDSVYVGGATFEDTPA